MCVGERIGVCGWREDMRVEGGMDRHVCVWGGGGEGTFISYIPAT